MHARQNPSGHGPASNSIGPLTYSPTHHSPLTPFRTFWNHGRNGGPKLTSFCTLRGHKMLQLTVFFNLAGCKTRRVLEPEIDLPVWRPKRPKPGPPEARCGAAPRGQPYAGGPPRDGAITPCRNCPNLPPNPIDEGDLGRYYLRITRLCPWTVLCNVFPTRLAEEAAAIGKQRFFSPPEGSAHVALGDAGFAFLVFRSYCARCRY